jgi:hypothetical protein
VGKFSRYILLLVASVLALAGMQAGHSAEVFCSLPQAVAEEQGPASLSAGEPIKFLNLTRTEEQVSLLHHLPGPPSKNQSGELYYLSYASELQLQRGLAEYIARAAHLHLSLSSCDIIFPFHNFW